MQILWETVTEDLPGLIDELEKILPSFKISLGPIVLKSLTGALPASPAFQGGVEGSAPVKPTATTDLLEKITKAHNLKTEHEERIRRAESNGIVNRRGW